MTQEEKAKAYDEALKRAKFYHGNCPLEPERKKLEEMFPELAESEDERIRNWLISLFDSTNERFVEELDNYRGNVTRERILAYLERQKEPSISATEVLIKAGLKPYKDGNQWCVLAGDNIQEGICGFGDTIDEALYQFLIEVLEKQKESLHITETCKENADSFTDEDERIRKALIDEIKAWDEHYKLFKHVSKEKVLAYLEKQKELTKENVIKELEKEFYACSTTPKWFHKTVQDAINIGKAEAFREIQKEYDRVREKEIEDIDYGIAIEEWEKQEEQKPTDEDERIIQELIDYLNPDIPFKTVDIDTVNKFIAWLEKQKEATNFAELMNKLSAKEQEVMFNAWPEEEQKPVKIDEDIKLGLDRALMIVKDAKGELPGYQTDDGIYECDHAIRTLIHILKNGIALKPILEVFGFKVGDAVRLKDGDGRTHIIKSFEEIEGLHGPNFYHVEFEDNSARDDIYPGEEYPNGYYTQMEKLEEEQKPAEWDELQADFRNINEAFEDGKKEVVAHPEKYGLCKPVEWSKEDDALLKEIVSFFKDGTVKLQHDLDLYAGFLENKFKSLYPQPKQEWSDEDKKMIERLITRLNWITYNTRTDSTSPNIAFFDEIDFLKSLPERFNLQPKEEWNEEDEQWLESIIKDYEDSLTKDKDHAAVIKVKIDFLKSLRPSKDCSGCAKHLEGYISGRIDAENKLLEQFGALVTPEDELHIKPRWKPSEEQMEALKYAVRLYKDTHFEKFHYKIESLYEQLKKLL